MIQPPRRTWSPFTTPMRRFEEEWLADSVNHVWLAHFERLKGSLVPPPIASASSPPNTGGP
jgi:hypothetical protein